MTKTIVFLSDTGDDTPAFHKVAEATKMGHLQTECGVLIRYSSGCALIPQVHAEKFGKACPKCYA